MVAVVVVAVVPSPKSMSRDVIPPLGSVLPDESAVTCIGAVPVCGVTVSAATGGLVVDVKNSVISGALGAPPRPVTLAPTSSPITRSVLS